MGAQKEPNAVNRKPGKVKPARTPAAYASRDRDEVLKRIQGIKKATWIKVYMDAVELRSGQNWERELFEVIPASDVFYLFWSRRAKKSRWVEKEWRCAFEKRGSVRSLSFLCTSKAR
jgi:hypothetical protein